MSNKVLMEILSNREAVQSLLAILKNRASINNNTQSSTELLVADSALRVRQAMFESLFEKINPAELDFLKIGLLSTDLSTENLNQQEFFLKSILNLMENENSPPDILKKLILRLQNSEFLKDSYKNLDLNKLNPEIIKNLSEEILKTEQTLLRHENIADELGKIINQSGLLKLEKVINFIVNKSETKLDKQDKKLANVILSLIKSSSQLSEIITNQIPSIPQVKKTAEIKAEIKELVSEIKKFFRQPEASMTAGITTNLASVIEKLKDSSIQKVNTAQKSALAFELIKISINLRSPEILQISADLLRTNDLNNKSLSELILPLTKVIDNIVKSNSINRKIIARDGLNFQEQKKLHDIRHNQSEYKSSNIKSNFESAFTESLGKLNQIADKQGLDSYQLMLLPFATKLVELKLKAVKQFEISEEQKNQQSVAGHETEEIECNICMPNLGAVNIKISVLSENIAITLNTESEKSSDAIKAMVTHLSDNLSNQGFQKPMIGVNIRKSKQIKPDWILDLISLQKTC